MILGIVVGFVIGIIACAAGLATAAYTISHNQRVQQAIIGKMIHGMANSAHAHEQ